MARKRHTVDEKPAVYSKINAIAALGALVSGFFVTNSLGLSPTGVANAVALTGLATSAAIIVARTWFTTSVTPQSMKR